MALRARLRDALDLDVQSIWSDDGIALHFPDADVPPPLADMLLEPDEIEDLLLGELAQWPCTGRGSGRTRRVRCSSPAAARASARRSGSSG